MRAHLDYIDGVKSTLPFSQDSFLSKLTIPASRTLIPPTLTSDRTLSAQADIVNFCHDYGPSIRAVCQAASFRNGGNSDYDRESSITSPQPSSVYMDEDELDNEDIMSNGEYDTIERASISGSSSKTPSCSSNSFLNNNHGPLDEDLITLSGGGKKKRCNYTPTPNHKNMGEVSPRHTDKHLPSGQSNPLRYRDGVYEPVSKSPPNSNKINAPSPGYSSVESTNIIDSYTHTNRVTPTSIFSHFRTYGDRPKKSSKNDAFSHISAIEKNHCTRQTTTNDSTVGYIPLNDILVICKGDDDLDIKGPKVKFTLRPVPPFLNYVKPQELSFRYRLPSNNADRSMLDMTIDIKDAYQTSITHNEFSLSFRDKSLMIDGKTVDTIVFHMRTLSDENSFTLKDIQKTWMALTGKVDEAESFQDMGAQAATPKFGSNLNRRFSVEYPKVVGIKGANSPKAYPKFNGNKSTLHYTSNTTNTNLTSDPSFGNRVVNAAVSCINTSLALSTNNFNRTLTITRQATHNFMFDDKAKDPLLSNSKYFKDAAYTGSRPSVVRPSLEISPARFYGYEAREDKISSAFDSVVHNPKLTYLSKITLRPKLHPDPVELRNENLEGSHVSSPTNSSSPYVLDDCLESPINHRPLLDFAHRQRPNSTTSGRSSSETFKRSFQSISPLPNISHMHGKTKRLSTLGISYRETDLEAADSLVTLSSGTPKIPSHPFLTQKIPGNTKILRYRPKTPPIVPSLPHTVSTEAIDISYGDVRCLEENEFLNDTIIDFYLRYIWYEKLDYKMRDRVHIFSSFFYSCMTSRLKSSSQSSKHCSIDNFVSRDDPDTLNVKDAQVKENILTPIDIESPAVYSIQLDSQNEDDGIIDNYPTSESTMRPTVPSLATTIHEPVRKWTKNVDIFSKRYVVIPINKDAHWFVAIVCFTGKLGPVSKANNTEPPSDYPPAHIIILDSLTTPSNHVGLARNIRAYLTQEWKCKKGESFDEDAPPDKRERAVCPFIFDTINTPSVYPRVPQQNNYHDCGLYLLHYVEVFLESPPDWNLFSENYRNRCEKMGLNSCNSLRKHFTTHADWAFSPTLVCNKRKEIINLIINLREREEK